MPKLIIVCGLPGVGKTTLARELSRKLKICCLHKDSIKEKIYEGLELSTLEDSRKIGKPSIDVMLYLAEQQLGNGVDVIIEAPFIFTEDYHIFEAWKEKHNTDLFSVICSIDTKERSRRFNERERHHSHYDWKRVVDHFPENGEYDYAKIPGKQIRIRTDKSTKVLVEEIISQIE